MDLAMSALMARDVDPLFADLVEQKSYLLTLVPDLLLVRLGDVIERNAT